MKTDIDKPRFRISWQQDWKPIEEAYFHTHEEAAKAWHEKRNTRGCTALGFFKMVFP